MFVPFNLKLKTHNKKEVNLCLTLDGTIFKK